MIKIKYVEANGTEHRVQAEAGASVMEVAVANNIPGIDADCGGLCACGTCHVYIDPPWFETMPSPKHDELEMLNFAAGAEQTSRLSCQIRLGEGHDGIVVRMPAGQH